MCNPECMKLQDFRCLMFKNLPVVIPPRAGSVSVFQVGVGYRLFFRLFFSRRSVFGFGFYKNLGFGVGFGFLRSTIYLIFQIISTACARPVGCMYMFTLYDYMSD
jgi:hypothetical protein